MKRIIILTSLGILLTLPYTHGSSTTQGDPVKEAQGKIDELKIKVQSKKDEEKANTDSRSKTNTEYQAKIKALQAELQDKLKEIDSKSAL